MQKTVCAIVLSTEKKTSEVRFPLDGFVVPEVGKNVTYKCCFRCVVNDISIAHIVQRRVPISNCGFQL